MREGDEPDTRQGGRPESAVGETPTTGTANGAGRASPTAAPSRTASDPAPLTSSSDVHLRLAVQRCAVASVTSDEVTVEVTRLSASAAAGEVSGTILEPRVRCHQARGSAGGAAAMTLLLQSVETRVTLRVLGGRTASCGSRRSDDSATDGRSPQDESGDTCFCGAGHGQPSIP